MKIKRNKIVNYLMKIIITPGGDYHMDIVKEKARVTGFLVCILTAPYLGLLWIGWLEGLGWLQHSV